MCFISSTVLKADRQKECLSWHWHHWYFCRDYFMVHWTLKDIVFKGILSKGMKYTIRAHSSMYY